MQLEVVGFQ